MFQTTNQFVWAQFKKHVPTSFNPILMGKFKKMLEQRLQRSIKCFWLGSIPPCFMSFLLSSWTSARVNDRRLPGPGVLRCWYCIILYHIYCMLFGSFWAVELYPKTSKPCVPFDSPDICCIRERYRLTVARQVANQERWAFLRASGNECIYSNKVSPSLKST